MNFGPHVIGPSFLEFWYCFPALMVAIASEWHSFECYELVFMSSGIIFTSYCTSNIFSIRAYSRPNPRLIRGQIRRVQKSPNFSLFVFRNKTPLYHIGRPWIVDLCVLHSLGGVASYYGSLQKQKKQRRQIHNKNGEFNFFFSNRPTCISREKVSNIS